jgi:hypothetical protein
LFKILVLSPSLSKPHKNKKMTKTNPKEQKPKREMAPTERVVTFNVHRALKGYVRLEYIFFSSASFLVN